MTAPQPTGEFIREEGTAPGVQVWNLQGMPWHDAPIPPRDHLCWTQTKGTLPDGNFVRRFVRRCACGAISMKDHDDRHMYWMDRNSRRVRALIEASASMQASIDQHIVALNAAEARAAKVEARLLSDELVTYKRADGRSIAGEYDWVTGLEWFEDDDEPTELIRETWQLVTREPYTVKPYGWDELQAELAAEEAEEADADVIPRKDYVISTPYPKEEQ